MSRYDDRLTIEAQERELDALRERLAAMQPLVDLMVDLVENELNDGYHAATRAVAIGILARFDALTPTETPGE